MSRISDLFPEVAPNVDGAMANDRYTTRATLDWCKRVLGIHSFDLDVAACDESHKALRWYGWKRGDGISIPRSSDYLDNGLVLPWDAERIWCNPPYDDLGPWVAKAWETMLANAVGTRLPIIGMLIPDNRREQPFWQKLIEPFRDGRWERSRTQPDLSRVSGTHHILVAHDAGVQLYTHSLPGRQPFGVPGNPEGIGQQSPPFGVVLLEWRFA